MDTQAPTNSTFDEENLIKTLQQLQGTTKSIENASNLFTEYAKEGQYLAMMDCYTRVAGQLILSNEQQRLISLIYLANDIIAKDKEFVSFFSDAISQIIEKICKNNGLHKLKSECLRVFEIWVQRQNFSSDVIKEWIDQLKSAQSQDEELASSLPDNLPAIPSELLQLVTNYNEYQKYKNKCDELQPTSPDYKKQQELMQKYNLFYIKNFKDVLSMMDKTHMKGVVELKLLIQKIDSMEKSIAVQ